MLAFGMSREVSSIEAWQNWLKAEFMENPSRRFGYDADITRRQQLQQRQKLRVAETECGRLMATRGGGDDSETPLHVKLNGVATFIGRLGLGFTLLTFLVLLGRFLFSKYTAGGPVEWGVADVVVIVNYLAVTIFSATEMVRMVTGGDGTNDALALHEADIGMAMGIAGTEVAKESADVIVCDDNFATIVVVAKWGRAVFPNIKKIAQFHLTVNLASSVIIFTSACLSGEAPLTAVQLLWVNLIMALLATAICSEKIGELTEVMGRALGHDTGHLDSSLAREQFGVAGLATKAPVLPAEDGLIDPRTGKIMLDPVKCSDGETYDRSTIVNLQPRDSTGTLITIIVEDMNMRMMLSKAYPDQVKRFREDREKFQEEAFQNPYAEDFEDKLEIMRAFLPRCKEAHEYLPGLECKVASEAIQTRFRPPSGECTKGGLLGKGLDGSRMFDNMGTDPYK